MLGARGYVPALDEILEVVRPLDARLGLILQLRDRLPHDVGEQIDQARPGLHLGPVGGEGEAVLGDLQERDARAPHVGGDGVALARDTLRGHVVGRADEGVCVAFRSELAAHAEVAQLDLAVAAQEDVAGLDVAVDDLLAVQVGEAVQHALGDLAEDFLAGAAAELLDFAVDGVEGAAFAEFHGDADRCCGRLDESAVVATDVLARAVFVEAELTDDLFLDVWVWVGGDDLMGG